MARCTAPVRGHSSSAAAEACPACRNKRGYGGSYGGGYGSGYSGGYSSSSSSYGSGGGGRSGGGSSRPRWSRSGSGLSYTPNQVQSLTPIRETVEARAASRPDLRDCFLCHAWGDRRESAKDFNDLLVAAGVKVWFSEIDLGPGVMMMRAIDKGLANSRIGLVFVTPNFLERIQREGVAERELSALLNRNLLVPILHGTTFEKLLDVSPLLASRSGFNTSEDSMSVIAAKIAELVNTTPITVC